jgi:hypothetical protein
MKTPMAQPVGQIVVKAGSFAKNREGAQGSLEPEAL